MNPSEAAAAAAIETTETTLLTIDADRMSTAIKAAGCAVTAIEQDGVVLLHSASHGNYLRHFKPAQPPLDPSAAEPA